MSSDMQYRSRAVRALVLLHEEHWRRFVHTWRLALATPVSLSSTDDPAYEATPSRIAANLRAARMTSEILLPQDFSNLAGVVQELLDIVPDRVF
jgi:hypothetical protein